MDISEIKNQLREVHLNYNLRDSKSMMDFLGVLKQQAVEQDDQDFAKEIWCLEMVLKIQDAYIDAYNSFKSEEYYKGWCSLERAQIKYNFLGKHFEEHDNEYWLEFINKHIIQYQSLFPYELFMSPEFIVEELVCGICGQVVKIRDPCGHKVGEIYDGEMCTLLQKTKLIGMAVVNSPVQKSTVIFLNDPKTGRQIDQYDYSLIKFVIDRIQSPFHNWDMYWTKKRHPHSRYEHIGETDECPCGSGKKYNDCCLRESGVLRPHCHIEFSVEPPKGVSKFEYTNSK